MANYTPEEIDRGLLALATQGSARDAANFLEAQGHPVPWRTLAHWRHSHAERYQQITSQHTRVIEDIIVQQAREAAIAAGNLEARVIEKLAEKLDDLPPKELAGAARNLATSKGINVDKLLVLTGRPSQIHETRNADELLRKLESLKITAIPGTATEDVETPPLARADTSNARELEQHTSS